MEDLPTLLTRQHEPLKCPELNRDVGRCGTCCSRQSTGNPLPSTLASTAANDKIGDNLNKFLEDGAAGE
eukprot:13211044-Ditylum_brightwellii.AAC.1